MGFPVQAPSKMNATVLTHPCSHAAYFMLSDCLAIFMLTHGHPCELVSECLQQQLTVMVAFWGPTMVAGTVVTVYLLNALPFNSFTASKQMLQLCFTNGETEALTICVYQ